MQKLKMMVDNQQNLEKRHHRWKLLIFSKQLLSVIQEFLPVALVKGHMPLGASFQSAPPFGEPHQSTKNRALIGRLLHCQVIHVGLATKFISLLPYTFRPLMCRYNCMYCMYLAMITSYDWLQFQHLKNHFCRREHPAFKQVPNETYYQDWFRFHNHTDTV